MPAPAGCAERLVWGYVRFLRRWRWALVALIVCILGPSAFFAPQFVTATSEDFNAPASSGAYKDRKKMEQMFPKLRQSSDLVLFIELPDRAKIDFSVDGPLSKFSVQLNLTASGWRPHFLSRFSSYWSMLPYGAEAAAPFRSPHPHTDEATIVDMQILTGMTSDDARDFSKHIKDALGTLQRQTNTTAFAMTLLGEPAFVDVMIDDATADLEQMDSIVLPMAVLVLAWLLGSLRLIILPLCCLGLAAATSFAIMDVVAHQTQVFSGVSALMMSILIAMSIDYGLFLCSRYKEELQKLLARCAKKEVEDDTMDPVLFPVVRMLQTAGHTITVSGLTLIACFCGLAFLKVTIMQTLGIGCAVLLVCVLSSNLVLIPLALLTFPSFWQRCLDPGPVCPLRNWCANRDDPIWRSWLCGHNGEAADEDSSDSERGDHIDVVLAKGCEDDVTGTRDQDYVDNAIDRNSCLYRAASKIVRFPCNILLLVTAVGVVIPFGFWAFTPKITNKQVNYLPYGSTVADAYEDMGAMFGFGQMFSYQLLMVPTDGKPVTDPGTWNHTRDALTRLTDSSACPKTAPITFLSNISGASLAAFNGSAVAVTIDEMQACCALDSVTRGPPPPAGVVNPGRSCPGLPERVDASAACSVLCARAGGSDCAALCAPLATYQLTGNLTKDCVDLASKGPDPDAQAACAVLANNTKTLTQLCSGLAFAWGTFVNAGATALYAQYAPMFDPMDPVGRDWLRDARDCAGAFPAELNLTMHFVSESADGIDVMDILFDDFAVMIGVTAGLVLLFIGLAFRSVFIPVRAVFTIACTLVFVFGFADLTYEHGRLAWTSTPGFHGLRSTGALIYFDPLFSFSVIVGLGLDYDVFLLTRIIEYRKLFAGTMPAKEATREAIVCGLCKTAGIITAAGVIMAVAFFGLMLSKEAVLNQLSFFMVFAVLFDTFIVRSILVPACMSLVGEVNWWPLTIRDSCSAPAEAEGLLAGGPPEVAEAASPQVAPP